MKTTIKCKDKTLKLVEVLTDLTIGHKLDFEYGDGLPAGTYVKGDDVILPAGSKVYYGDNPYNASEIILDLEGNEIADIILSDLDNINEIIKYL